MTPLLYAAEKGFYYAVRQLLSFGASQRECDSEYQNALHIATINNRFQIIFLLAEFDFDLDRPNSSDMTALHIAAREGCAESAVALCNLGANLNITAHGLTALHFAVANQNLNIASVLLDHGAKVTIKNEQGLKPFDMILNFIDEPELIEEAVCIFFANALTTRNGEYIRYFLMQHKEYINAKTLSGVSLLHLAVSAEGHLMFDFLMENDAAINVQTSKGETPLSMAVSAKKDKRILKLLDKGADPNLVAQGGVSPLHWAVANDYLGITKILIKYGADVNRMTDDGRSPLHFAADFNRLDIAKILIRAKADVNISGEDGQTPLMYAAQVGNAEMVDLLIASGAKIDAKSGAWLTALHYAVAFNHRDVVKHLLDAKADFNSCGIGRVTPYNIAKYIGDVQMMDILKTNKADTVENYDDGALENIFDIIREQFV